MEQWNSGTVMVEQCRWNSVGGTVRWNCVGGRAWWNSVVGAVEQ